MLYVMKEFLNLNVRLNNYKWWNS